MPDDAMLGSASEWRALELSARSLAHEPRAVVAREWARAAELEHASIASFNRFSLELLALAAPAELIAAANQAALDEVQHARLSFAIASAYAGVGLGPGRLSLTGVDVSNSTLAEAARSTASEGCVNETLSALEASAAAELATVPLIRAALERIAEDEGRHAALACRFVRWACELGGEDTRAAAHQGFFEALEQCRREMPRVGVSDSVCAEHGCLPETTRHRVRKSALAEVLEPLGAELFGASIARSA